MTRLLERGRIARFGRSSAFVLLTSAIVVVTSEKMYWYPGAYAPTAVAELVLFYSLAVMPLLYVMQRYSVGTLAGLVLASGVFSMVTEGIITPIVYSDGPLPVMFLYFVGWHGLISVVFIWYTVHRWAVLGRRRALGLWSGLLGLTWGLWSTDNWRAQTIAEQTAENLEEPGLWDVGQWAVPKFALFAFGFTALLIVCHWLLGFVWPAEWKPSRVSTVVVVLALGSWLALWTVAIPYAPVKFAAIVGLLVWLLGRSQRGGGGATLLSLGSGRVQFVNLGPLVAMPIGAVAGYSLMTGIDLGGAGLDAIYFGLVAATLAAGTLSFAWASQRIVRSKESGASSAQVARMFDVAVDNNSGTASRTGAG